MYYIHFYLHIIFESYVSSHWYILNYVIIKITPSSLYTDA